MGNAARDLIRQCLNVDPSKRLTITQFLAHPWLRQPSQLPAKTQSGAAPNGVSATSLRTPAVMREVDHNMARMKDVFDVSLAMQREAMDASGSSSNVTSSSSSSSSTFAGAGGAAAGSPREPFMLGTVGQSALLGKRKKQYEAAIVGDTGRSVSGKTRANRVSSVA